MRRSGSFGIVAILMASTGCAGDDVAGAEDTSDAEDTTATRADADTTAPDTCGPPPVCTEGWECDDADPCTLDECSCTFDNCGATCACAHTPNPECAPCDGDVGCDDGDDCTVDACDGGTCRHARDPGCGSLGCDSVGAQRISAVMEALRQRQGAPGDTFTGGVTKLFGTATASDVQVGVVEEPCECCVDRYMMPALTAGGETLRVTSPDDDVAWQCGVNPCGGAECAPMIEKFSYWAIGHPVVRYRAAAEPDGPIERDVEFVVDDYCLQTNPAGIAGIFAGRFTSEAAAWGAFDVTLTMEFRAASGWGATFERAPCVETEPCLEIVDQAVTALAVGDGELSFEVLLGDAADASAMWRMPVALVATQSALSGRLGAAEEEASGAPRGVMRLELTRPDPDVVITP